MRVIIILFLIILQISLFASNKIIFTEKEKKYLDSNPIVTIGSMDTYSPFSFIRDSQKVGYTQDIIKILAKETGIKFKIINGSWSVIFNDFRNGKIDMISDISHHQDRLSFTNYTKPYYEIPIGVFTRKDFGTFQDINSLEGKTVAILKDSYFIESIQDIKNIKLIEMDNNDDKFNALAQKKVDAIISNTMSLYRLDSIILNNIQLSGYLKNTKLQTEELRFGINKNKEILASIIRKTLNDIPYSKLTSLKKEWILKYDVGENNINFTQTEQKWIQENPIIIGIENAQPYIYFDDKTQKIDGFYADILKVVLKKTGLQKQYVSAEWSQLLKDFKEKKIDLLPATFYNKNREKFGNYTTDFYKVREYIYINQHNNTINFFKDLANKKVAIVAGYATIEKIKQKIPSITIVKTKNLEESIILLKTEQVDALIDYHLVVEDFIREHFILGLKPIVQHELEPFSVHYFSNIDKPLLQSILQKGLDSITREEKNKILQNWINIPNTQNEHITLTYKEKEFIKQHKTIRFRVSSNRPPFEFQEDGDIKGLAVDYIKKSAQNIGLDVEFVIDNSNIDDAYKTIETTQDKFDTLLFSVKNDARAKRFSFGKEFLSYPMMIITNKKGKYVNSLNDLNNHTIVLEKGFLTNKWIKRDYPKIKIINVTDTKKALKLVNQDKSIAYVGNLAVANFMILSEKMNNIQIVAPTPYGNVNYSFIAPKKWPELTSILTKGFNQISPLEHSTIQQKWFSLQTIEKTDYSLIWKIILIGILIIIWILWWNRKITQEQNKTKKALIELQQVQYNLEEKTKEQLQQQQIMLNQSKIASMGEMIGNIAHQWRQPLSVISTASTGLLVEKKFNNLSDEKLEQVLNTINNQAQYLSSTIDTFRDYIKSNKEVQRVIIQDSIEIAISIIEASFKNNFITIKSNLETVDNIEVNLVSGELSEVIINILNNAKDILIQKNVSEPLVKINLKKANNKAIISIEDNGGGIPENLISKIFEPYFTTKHQSQGTGLGLHMSYKIICESLHGKLYVKNSSNGAQFFIELPLA